MPVGERGEEERKKKVYTIPTIHAALGCASVVLAYSEMCQ
jgi:hypothetical protein